MKKVMIATFNEKHHSELFADARKQGTEVGAMVRERGWVAADHTMACAARAWVDKQPLADIRLERELHEAYLVAACKAAS